MILIFFVLVKLSSLVRVGLKVIEAAARAPLECGDQGSVGSFSSPMRYSLQLGFEFSSEFVA